MEDGVLLESVEGLGHSPFVARAGEIWELLQGEREDVSQELLSAGPLCQSETAGLRESDASETNGREVEWRRRGILEARLRHVNDALDRLLDGGYGRCTECGEEIDGKRLVVDPAAPLCIGCQPNADGETRFRHM